MTDPINYRWTAPPLLRLTVAVLTVTLFALAMAIPPGPHI